MKMRRLTVDQVSATRHAVDEATLATAKAIVDDVRRRGWEAVAEHAVRLGDIGDGQPMVVDRSALQQALSDLPHEQQSLLYRTAGRISVFAEAQKHALHDISVAVPGGLAGHTVAPVETAGCYAPGGRFPLPSSVLMTAMCARAAGVEKVWVASPRPTAVTLAAAAVAQVDGLLAVGGAQAIAALAYGAGAVPACDAVVGPGNRFVTAAKQLVAGHVAIDMLAGPSELVVLADASADAEVVAADLLAQAEHDPDALPVLVTVHEPLLEAVEAALHRQLPTLPTASNATAALAHGFAVLAANLDAAVEVCNRLAPEHLEVLLADPGSVMSRLRHYGGLFLGSGSAEVFGDYGCGPNHVLPTGGTARFSGGLSVFTFLRVRTWLRMDDMAAAGEFMADAAQLARLEGLEAHARAAERRLS